MAIKFTDLNAASDLEAKMTKTPVDRKTTPSRFSADKKTAPAASGKLEEALDIISKIETVKAAPKKKLSGKTKTITIRLDTDVVDAWKKNATGYTAAMGAVLKNYAQRNGWL